MCSPQYIYKKPRVPCGTGYYLHFGGADDEREEILSYFKPDIVLLKLHRQEIRESGC